MAQDARGYRLLSEEKRLLPVKLGPEELRERGRQAGALCLQIESLDEEIEGLKSRAKALALSVDVREIDRRTVERALRTETEDRMVEVRIEAEMRTGTVREVRVDTGEVLRERAMTPDEAQGTMFSFAPEPGAGAEGESEAPTRRRGKPPLPRPTRREAKRCARRTGSA